MGHHMLLAIADGERVFEGNEIFLNAVYPMPRLSKVWDHDDAIFGSKSFISEPIFREDFFDPTTRIRRGRFYVPCDPDRKQWQDDRVNYYPYPHSAGESSPWFKAYQSFIPNTQIKVSKRPIMSLGDSTYRTVWNIIDGERLFNGETLFTLKSSNTMGVLPDLNESALPREKRVDILESIEKVADAAHKYLPVPIVDVCRESARCMLAAWLPTVGGTPKGDLGKIIKNIPGAYVGIRSSAEIINRLHPRGKSSERDRQAEEGKHIRDISHEDGEFSVSLIAFLLREFRWTL